MTATVELRCVCSHSAAEHQPVQLSVPLKGKNLYPAPMPLIPVAEERSQIRATYDSVQCHCGCTSVLVDDDRADWVHLARVDG